MSPFGERFLVSPALFPARNAGETWGSEAIELALPGGRYRVSGLTATQSASLSLRYGARANPAGDLAALEIVVYRAPASDFLSFDTRGWEYTLDLESDENATSIAGMRLMARLANDGTRAAIWTPVDDREEFWGIVENILRPLVARRLLAAGGLLIHSAGVDLAGSGFLFAGESGAGKSTVARLALDHGHPVLSDDLNAVLPAEGGGFNLVPLPFTGDLETGEVSDTAVPLSMIVRLEKGSGESTRLMPLGAAISLLVRSAPYVNYDSRQMSLLLTRAGEIAGAARRTVLTFRRDGVIWPILESL